MDRGLRLLTLALVLVVLALVVHTSTSPPECPAEASLAVCRVEVEVNGFFGKQKGSGSGVVISKHRILTACHVVSESQTAGVVFTDADGVETRLESKTVMTDPARDLALLEVSEDLPDSIVIGIGAAEDLKEYDPLWIVGAVQGESPHTRTRGEFISRHSVYEENRWYAACPVAGGASGGAVLDSHGWLVGMVTAGDNTGTIMLFAPLSQIVAFIEENPEPVAEAGE